MGSPGPTPLSEEKNDSSRTALRGLFAQKPGISWFKMIGVLPSWRTKAVAMSIVSDEVSGPATISAHCITSAGLKKCTLQTWLARPVASASLDDTKLEELVARIVCGGVSRSRSANRERLTSRVSTAASITTQ